MRKLFIITLFLCLGTVTLAAQDLTSNAAYRAYIDSLSRVYATLETKEITSNAAYKAYIDSLETEYGQLIEEWNETIPPHFIEAMRLEKEAEAHPEWKDSLLALAAEERRIGQSLMPSLQAEQDRIQEMRNATMLHYALVYEDAFLYFSDRKNYTKDELADILKSASAEIRHSPRGKALKKYIRHNPPVEGDKFKTFRCYDVNGKRFDWSLCKGKKVFLIHDGLWCMTHGMDNSALRNYLQHITEAAPECFPLIFVNGETKEELQKSVETYGLQDFWVVSEFQKDYGTLNWLYNDTVTPTCHYIDERGILVKTTGGIDTEYLEKEFLRIKETL